VVSNGCLHGLARTLTALRLSRQTWVLEAGRRASAAAAPTASARCPLTCAQRSHAAACTRTFSAAAIGPASQHSAAARVSNRNADAINRAGWACGVSERQMSYQPLETPDIGSLIEGCKPTRQGTTVSATFPARRANWQVEFARSAAALDRVRSKGGKDAAQHGKAWHLEWHWASLGPVACSYKPIIGCWVGLLSW